MNIYHKHLYLSALCCNVLNNPIIKPSDTDCCSTEYNYISTDYENNFLSAADRSMNTA